MDRIPQPHLARFGVFELDLRARELRKAGLSTGLPEQPIKILALLLEKPGDVVLREEIRKKLWPNDTVVEFDHSINAAIKRLRQALGDPVDAPQYIETLARRGYRWKIPVEWVRAEREVERAGAQDASPSRALAGGGLIAKMVSHYRVLEVLGRSAAFSLEQAIIPGLVPDASRTWSLAWYNVVLDAAGSLGALAAALPLLLHRWLTLPLLASYHMVFLGCTRHRTCRFVFSGCLRRRISDRCTRGLLVFSTLWGGGRKLGCPLLCCARAERCLSSGAAWLARRIGLVNTMVFTHLPSSLFLVAAAFAPSLKVAVVLFLCREALVEIDVPTRQSYVAVVVEPNERTFASGVANLARNVFWAVGSSVAGVLMRNVAFSAPLVLGGGAKISYDLLLYRAFRKLRPPEER